MQHTADEKDFAEQRWIARYLDGRLSDAEADLFEQHWERNPALIRDIEAQARLKDGLHSLHDRGELERVVHHSWWSGRFRLMALAASLAVIGISSWLWMASSRTAVPLRAAASLAALPVALGRSVATADTYHLMRLRSTHAGSTLRLPAEPRAILLRVLPETSTDLRQYHVVIAALAADGTTGPSASIDTAGTGDDGFVDLYLDSRTLAPGRYRVSVAAPGDADGAAGSFELQVVGADTAL